jgi:hypothetical protein
MAHARPADLRDIADVLGAIRALAGLTERSPGVFYLGRVPFLHFHTDAKAGTRWADAKDGATWAAELPLPFGADQRRKAAFIREVTARHRACAASVPRARA